MPNLARTSVVALFSILVQFIAWVSLSTAEDREDPISVAKAYFEAMDAADLDAAGELFIEHSMIFETGGAEGNWEQYRTHHLGPEIDAIAVFETSFGEPDETASVDETMVLVTWPIEYHIELTDGRIVDSKGTVTFVLVQTQLGYRILHLHWSSRRKT